MKVSLSVKKKKNHTDPKLLNCSVCLEIPWYRMFSVYPKCSSVALKLISPAALNFLIGLQTPTSQYFNLVCTNCILSSASCLWGSRERQTQQAKAWRAHPLSAVGVTHTVSKANDPFLNLKSFKLSSTVVTAASFASVPAILGCFPPSEVNITELWCFYLWICSTLKFNVFKLEFSKMEWILRADYVWNHKLRSLKSVSVSVCVSVSLFVCTWYLSHYGDQMSPQE